MEKGSLNNKFIYQSQMNVKNLINKMHQYHMIALFQYRYMDIEDESTV